MSINFKKWLCQTFNIGCPPPTPVPPAPKVWNIGVVATDDSPISGNCIVGARCETAGQVSTTDEKGFHLFVGVPEGPQEMKVSKDGYNDSVVPYVCSTATNVFTKMVPSHVDPSKFSLRDLAKIRGAMWTVRGPWQFGPRPGQPTNITALEYIYSYPPDEQKAMLAKYKSYGYTHVAFGPINAQSYHGQYPDTNFTSPDMFEKWLDYLQMFWDNGLAPICFLHPDGGTFEDTVAMYDHLIRGNDRAQKLMRIVVPTGWEPTRYDWSSVTWAKFCAWGREILPNALVLIHTVADVDAPVGTDALYDDNGYPNGEGWARVVPHIHGWLIQNGAYDKSPSEDPELALNFAAQFDKGSLGASKHGVAWHFQGNAGWPTNSAWGNTPIKLYNAECTSYNAYWYDFPYDKSCAWGDLAIQHGADGYLDGGTVPVN